MRIPAAVYLMLGLAMTLVLSVPASLSAQVPIQRQPRAAEPAREGVIQTPAPAEAPAAQAPGQPTAAPAADAPAEPAPVSAAPAPSGVTQLPPAAAPPATANSSQAATAASDRAYGAGKFGLTLDGIAVGWPQSVEGGGASSDVILEPPGPDHISLKHIGNVKYEPIAVETDLQSKPLIDWIAGSWKGNTSRKNGSIQNLNYDYKVMSELDFFNALVVETTMPTLDAASKDVARMTVKLSPEYTRAKAGSAVKAPAGNDPRVQKRWLETNFRFEMTGLNGTKVNKIDSFTVRLVTAEHSIGEQRDYEKASGKLEFPNLRITLGASTAQTWVDWHDDFVIKGNSGAAQERSGAIVYLDPTRTVELGRVNLSNCGIFRLGQQKVEAGRESIPRMVADLYCERMELVTK